MESVGKVCTKCSIWKTLEEYPRCYREKDGRHDRCKPCRNAAKRAYEAANKEYVNAKSTARRKANLERYRGYQKTYMSKPDKFRKVKEYQKAYRQSNKGKINAKTARYRYNKLQRIPKWADIDLINKIYQNCPPGYHVDHIIPLSGKKVSGLHVECNLQYLPGRENEAKNNKFYLQVGENVFYTEKEFNAPCQTQPRDRGH